MQKKTKVTFWNHRACFSAAFSGAVARRCRLSAPVLILGDGAARVSCAVADLGEGATVWLLEAEPQMFAAQMATSTRTIDPGAFDWLLAHGDLCPSQMTRATASPWRTVEG